MYASAGTYTVELTVTTSVGSDTETKTGLITVEGTGPIIVGRSGTGFKEVGDSAVLNVDVTGVTPPVTYEWFKHGSPTPVANGGRISGADTPRSPSAT